jgi:hypothetical protein
VTIKDYFAVTASVISDASENIILATTQKFHSTNVLSSGTSTTLLVTRLTAPNGYDCFALEGDAFLMILAVNQSHLFSTCQFALIVSNITLDFSSFFFFFFFSFFFLSCKALKVSKCVNFHAHLLAEWTAIHLVFGNISIRFLILSSI